MPQPDNVFMMEHGYVSNYGMNRFMNKIYTYTKLYSQPNVVKCNNINHTSVIDDLVYNIFSDIYFLYCHCQ